MIDRLKCGFLYKALEDDESRHLFRVRCRLVVLLTICERSDTSRIHGYCLPKDNPFDLEEKQLPPSTPHSLFGENHSQLLYI